MLKYIPRLITDEENEAMGRMPDMEEVKKAVFDLSGNSAAGPDGYIGKVFQKCWDIVVDNLLRAVKAFFYGYELPRSVTHTKLVLIPKKELPNIFSDLRPINLSCNLNKIVSRVVHERILMVLPKIISPNQSGFVKGRSIVENVLLAQEIIRYINKRNILVNVVVKLYMGKTYDRVSWIYVTMVMRKLGFSEVLIDMVWRLLSNNWYSVLVNRQSFRLF